MNQHDFVSGLVWLSFSICVAVEGITLGIGPFNNPGAGFVLFWSSLFLAILSFCQVIRSVRPRAGGTLILHSFQDVAWINVLLSIMALVVYSALLAKVGFIVISFLFMVFLYWLGRIKLWVAAMSALVTIAVAYSIFHFALLVQFPRGLFGW